ncbi:NADH:flavorubredoxin reductase NorW [Chimaeribacter californicus]|uniref:NADH:flavorubredoxin reductase NorW n=1 Tax=Chimaeribacter californicus TaxID=2060067 RepID=A0A2N5DW94_9GAMM|nr:NADH:flavorubredoxin reductase NorW [Chimaeribacter californicus]PLR31466.1 NADH:flavorubredoxin reductase NorW [Chimaeribacter californicus]
MTDDIIIIGSGFAARQLIKNLRRLDNRLSLRLIAADSCDEYNKPELSQVFSQRQRAEDLTRLPARAFAESHNLMLHPHTPVTRINRAAHRIETNAGAFTYRKLVLALGAEPRIPAIPGREWMHTLNSQQEYRRAEAELQGAQRVLLLGGGLIGTELAMDLNRAGKQVMLVDRAAALLATLMPPEVSARLQHRLIGAGVQMYFNAALAGLARQDDQIVATLADGRTLHTDAVVCAIGLVPNIALAQEAGLQARHGIVVDDCLTTSDPAIFALGDCAEIQGRLLPYLQPAQLAAMTLAKNLTGAQDSLRLPPMLIKVKTPDLPLHLAGQTTAPDLHWAIEAGPEGLVACGRDGQQQLQAFVVSEGRMKQAFQLLKQLPDTARHLCTM